MNQKNKLQCKTSLIISQKLIFYFTSYKSIPLMINYSEFDSSPVSQHCIELFQREPLHDFHILHFNGINNQINPSVNKEEAIEKHKEDSQIEHNHLFYDHSHQQQSEILIIQQDNQCLKESSNSQLSKDKQKQFRRLKNQTKNIPKNFGKGIISFIEKKQKKIRAIFQRYKLPFNTFKSYMMGEKKTINTIADLRRLWTTEPYCKCMRIISNMFFRCYALSYIFNSRITNYSSHIKYRQSLWQALKNPEEFNHIKEY